MMRIDSPLRWFVVWAMLSPFLMLALLPAAVMPLRTAENGLTVVLCSENGPVQLVIDPATGAPLKKGTSSAGERCAWAGAHVAALGPMPSDLPAPMLAVAGRQAAVLPMILVAARATGRPPATGPPSLV